MYTPTQHDRNTAARVILTQCEKRGFNAGVTAGETEVGTHDGSTLVQLIAEHSERVRNEDRYAIGDGFFDARTNTVYYADKTVVLTPKQFEITTLIARKAGAITAEDILSRASPGRSAKLVHVMVCQIRARFKAAGLDDPITNVYDRSGKRGGPNGYRWNR